MLSYPEFVASVQTSVPRFQGAWLNAEQDAAVAAPPHPPTLIVAGPGTGKTTVLALRALKLVFVDGSRPESVVATTFTRKAAAELRSRILSWGYATWNYASAEAGRSGNVTLSQALQELDINKVIVGTIDSIAERFLAEHRPAGEITPAVINTFLARALLRRADRFGSRRLDDANLQAHLSALTPSFPGADSLKDRLSVALSFADRVRQDRIHLSVYSSVDNGHRLLGELVDEYRQYLEENHLADYGRIEEMCFESLQSGRLGAVTDSVKALLVDEFQDTNSIQESIYFELCRRSQASLTVVGDDDQSIFRFRGATVEIFADFENRIQKALSPQWRPHRVNLVRNYRSTSRIVGFCNEFITLDAGFHGARTSGKPALQAAAPHAFEDTSNLPILGMFRADAQELADSLSSFLFDVFRGNGHPIQCRDRTYLVKGAPDGDFGDSVLLARSVQERTKPYGARSPRARLPLLLRDSLRLQGVRAFNPRGRQLGDIEEVKQLLGLALECIDPGSAVQASVVALSPRVRVRLNEWRQTARQFVATNPAPGKLDAFVKGWQSRQPASSWKKGWPRDWPLLDLVFALAAWIPMLHAEPEGQVYLEAVARTIAEVGQIDNFGAHIFSNANDKGRRSIERALHNIFEPLASDTIEIEEDIMPHVPRNYFPMMTVHQAKGLEFPLVIADVGSDFKTNHHTQKFSRFPEQGGNVHMVEDETSSYCAIGPARTSRSALDRAWDDLRRQYFVAYSRPESVLLLAGLTSSILLSKPVLNIAVGDFRGGPRGISFVAAAEWDSGLPHSHVALI